MNKEFLKNVTMAVVWSAAFIGILFVINGCQKENKNSGNCQCYEEHQELQTPSIQWEVEYTTPMQEEPCSNAHDWVETSQVKRYRKICQ